MIFSFYLINVQLFEMSETIIEINNIFQELL